MAKEILTAYTTFLGGIADFSRFSTLPGSFAFARSIDVRSDPYNITVLPRTIKESGSVITDLPKWAETYNSTLLTYIYGETGNLYTRTSAGSYALLSMIPNSHGNGMVYSAEDDYLYGASDKLIWRYGNLSSSSPTLVTDFFGSQGGIPLNTNALDLEASSSQYASRADTASLSITGNIAFDFQIKPESLPTVGNQMVIASKWDESGTLRSYKFDINTASGYFGDGSDGNLTISSNTTEAPIDSACTGTSGASTLTATNASFAAGQIIMIHQTRGTNAGRWERNTIASYTAGTITLGTALISSYTSGAQVRVLKQYTNVTINNGFTYTAKAWNGTVGGIIAFIASGTITVTGAISANGSNNSSVTGNNTSVAGATGGGFRGGIGYIYSSGGTVGGSGEGTSGASVNQVAANGNGGGGGNSNALGASGGAGGGNGSAGTNGAGNDATNGIGGSVAGSADLTTIELGGGGGGTSMYSTSGGTVAGGASGGGIVFLTGSTVTVTGAITANGGNGGLGSDLGAGGSGGGGSILVKTQTATLGTGLITANGGTPTTNAGGNGGTGRVHIDYYTSYTGTTTPTINATQDNTLVTNTSYQLRLSISSTGLNTETLAYTAALTTGVWQQVGISWKSSTKTATFFLNSVSLGTRIGALGAIHDNASTFQIGMSKDGAGAAANFFDGLIDEGRVFNVTRTASEMVNGINSQIAVNTPGLVAYYKFNGDYVDAVAGLNTLTASGSPVFTSDVPYPSPTTRLDIDQYLDTTGSTYAVPTSISESSTNRQTFTPEKDPQKSIQFNVANIGTGDWTVTVHDQYNNTIATSTVLAADMRTGDYEFTYSTPWRPLTNFTNDYHVHVTCTSGSPTITSTTSNDLETADFVTYFQFLVTDTAWHPMMRFLQFWVVGNERYVGKYEATLYEPNKIVLQAGYRVRSFALWREYLAIGAQKGTNIYDFDNGRVYFWDGYSPTFNFFIDVPEGGVNAMLGSRGKLYIWAGYKNQLLVYEGGDSAQKLKDMPLLENNKYSEIYPQAVTMWNGLLRYGVAGNGDSTTVNKGVYTWGSTNAKYPDILTYDYPISTGNYTGTSVKVGLTAVVNKKLLIGWQDGIGYGMDYVDTSNTPYPSAMVQFLITDNEQIWKEKNALEIDANFSPLESDQAIDLSFSIDEGTFVTNSDPTETDDTVSRLILGDERYHEGQVQLDITSGVTAPSISGVLLVSDGNETEGRTG